MPKVHVFIPAKAMRGNAELRLGPKLPRQDKRQLELMLSTIALQKIFAAEDVRAHEIRPNEDDPPDVLFELNDVTYGMEVVELLPENRLAKDAILQSIRKGIVSHLDLGEQTRDWVVTFMLTQDYASEIRIPRCEDALATALSAFFESAHLKARCPVVLPVPQGLEPYIARIIVEPQDLRKDPRLCRRDEPLILFSAQHTRIEPEQDLPMIVDRTVHRKALHALAIPSWLLLWSANLAFLALEGELVQCISRFLSTHTVPYRRIFYLQLVPVPRLTEFSPSRDDPTAIKALAV